MARSSGEDDEQPDVEGCEVEDLCFELLLAGVPENIIWGYHDGWPFPRLLRLYLYLRRMQILDQEAGTLSVAIGASALFNKQVLTKFQSKTRRAITKLDESRGSSERSKEQVAKADVQQFQKIFGMMGGQRVVRGQPKEL